MTPRFHVDRVLAAGAVFDLPAPQARHVQVLRLQPGDALTLFTGRGGEWAARVVGMGRATVEVSVDAHVAVDRELARSVTLACGMPANERMDALVEKATELGVASIQPLICERSVLRLSGERAARRLEHWQGIAAGASEQSGRTVVPLIHPVLSLRGWLDDISDAPASTPCRIVLSPDADMPFATGIGASGHAPIVVLSGPEGGLSPAEVNAARVAGFMPMSLGPRVLRADTAPLAVLAWCGLDAALQGPG
ncbi:MAG: 16S rRNA (uracil(1498)-N(3))-methyltransferase [Caldimonas sp.]